jgi:long-chain acyl-CoA synthetase
VALIVPDLESVKKWAGDNGVSAASDDELVNEPRVKQMLLSEVEKHSAEFKGFERIKKITVTKEDFTTQNDMLTPSLKLKRRVVWQKYGPQIEALYAEGQKNAQPSA